MVLFRDVIYDKKANELVYSIDRYTLEDMGEEQRKTQFGQLTMDYFIKKHQDKEKALNALKYHLDMAATMSFENAETQLLLFGIDSILWDILKIINDDE